MSNSQQLFDLIKSLSKNEKRNFKLYAQLHSSKGTSSYLQLFDVLDKMKIYDESISKKKFAAEKKVTQFNPMVNYLFDVIINSLSTYNNKNFTTIKLKKKVHSAFILREKGIHDKSRKLLIAAKKEAVNIEDFTTLLEIYKLTTLNLTDKERLQLMKEEGLVIQKIDNIHFYNQTLAEMSFLFRKKEMAREKDDLSSINKLLNIPLLKDEELAVSNTAKQLFHHIKTLYYYFIGDYQKALSHLITRISYLNTSPEFLSINFDSYLSCTHNIITLHFLLKNFKNASDVIDDLFLKLNSKQHTFSVIVQSKIFRIYAIGKSELFLKTGEFNAIQPFLLNVEKNITKYKQHLTATNLVIIYNKLSLIYFNIQDYKNALAWINKSSTYQKQFDRPDLVVFIQLFNIIIHYEIGNKELISYLERSSRRYVKNEKRLFKSETILLQFFRLIILKINTKEEALSSFEKLKEELIEVFKDPLESKLLIYFDFIAWIDSKIENRSFIDVVREKTS